MDWRTQFSSGPDTWIEPMLHHFWISPCRARVPLLSCLLLQVKIDLLMGGLDRVTVAPCPQVVSSGLKDIGKGAGVLASACCCGQWLGKPSGEGQWPECIRRRHCVWVTLLWKPWGPFHDGQWSVNNHFENNYLKVWQSLGEEIHVNKASGFKRNYIFF